ncbi:L-lactate transporter [subsurface metagenome]
MMGVNSSFGVFFKSLESTFGLTRATTSAVLSGRMAFSCLFAVLGGWAIDRYRPKVVFSIMGLFIGISLILTSQTTAAWQLFVTYSLLMAIGVGAFYVVTTSTILRWFDRRRGLALGITGSGGGLGIALVAPLATFLIESFEWRNALMMLGVIVWLVMIPVAQLLRKDPYEIGALPDGAMPGDLTARIKEDITSPPIISLVKVFQTKNFWSFLFIGVLLAFSWVFVLTHIVPHATDLGFSAIQSATILSLTGIAMIAGRLLTGALTDKISAKVIAVISSLLQAGVLLWLVWGQELWMLYLFGLLHGFTMGGFTTANTVLIGGTFGLKDIGKILGVLEIGIFIGAATGPYFGGLIFDVSSSYTLAFLIMAGTVLARIPLVALITREKKRC